MSSTSKALLLVYTEPGANVDEADFNHWYDNEHVPLRANIPEVFTGGISRIKSIDGSKPAFAAIYDVESAAALQKPAYSNLTETRSERERDIFARIGVVDRRVYEAYAGPSIPPSPRFDENKGGAYTIVVEKEVPGEAEDDFNKWYDEEHIPLLSRIPGWLRSRRFVLVEESVFGTDTGPHKRTGRPAKYLAVHEWETSNASGKSDTPEYKEAMDTEWMVKVNKTLIARTKREFELLRAW
ncbi:unnamed protein product [Peniophora sp. CBMAI 1063]|nr:unnamed protein product [Peniophora sp. CBMAI 1063]